MVRPLLLKPSALSLPAMKHYNGFSLIEVIISGALIATTAGGLFAAATTASRLTTLGQERVVASQLSREGIEAVRQIRNAVAIDTVCQPSEPCTDWRDRILSPEERQTLPQQAIPKAIVSTPTGFRLDTVALADASCTEYLRRDTLVSDPSVRTEQGQYFCRRIFIEPVAVSGIKADQVIRVRSQVAWVGNGRAALRVFSGSNSISISNKCDTTGEEWCTEQVTLLTNWRIQ